MVLLYSITLVKNHILYYVYMFYKYINGNYIILRRVYEKKFI